MEIRHGAAVLLAVAVFVGACGGGSGAPAGVASTVTVTLTDLKIDASVPSVPAGTVTFNVTNKGSTAHDLILIKTDLAQDKLPSDPADPSRAQVTGSLATTGQMAVATTKSFSRALTAGNYVLICNEPGHYVSGMHMAFTVK